jgi:hypothetical protein
VYNLSEINPRDGITGAGFLCGIFLGFFNKNNLRKILWNKKLFVPLQKK